MAGSKIEDIVLLSVDELYELVAEVLREISENEIELLHRSIGHRTIHHYAAAVVLSMIEYAAQYQMTADDMWESLEDPDIYNNQRN